MLWLFALRLPEVLSLLRSVQDVQLRDRILWRRLAADMMRQKEIEDRFIRNVQGLVPWGVIAIAVAVLAMMFFQLPR